MNGPLDRNAPSTPKLLEIVEIDRRRFLLIAGSGLIALGSIDLIGCGGGGAGTGPGAGSGTVANTAFTVQLPTGTSLSPSQLTACYGLGTQPVASTGKSSVSVTAGAPTLVTLQNSVGKGVLMGFVNGGTSSNVINAQSTATALLYFAFGAYGLSPAAKAQVIDSINTNGATTTFAGVIASRMATNPTAIQDGDSQIGTAFMAAFTALGGQVAALNRVKNQIVAKPQAVLPQLLVQPSGVVSGFEVNQSDNVNSIVGVNHFRRPARLYVYKIGDVDLLNNETDLTAAELQGTYLDVLETAPLGITSTIANLFNGSTAFTPVSTSSITLPLASGDSKTLYEVVVLFAAASTTAPSFYSLSRYSGQVSTWNAARQTLNIRAFLVDLVFGFVLELFGISQISASESQLASIADAIAAAQDAGLAAALQEAAAGSFGPSVELAANSLLNGASIGKYFRQSLSQFIPIAEQRAAFLAGQVPSAGLAILKGGLAAAEILLGAGDLSAVLTNLGSSDQGDIWTATVIEPPIHLNPSSASFDPQNPQPILFTATPPTGTTGTLEWAWELTGAVAAQISDQKGHQGTKFVTSSNTVYLLGTPTDTNTMTLTVEAASVASNGTKTGLGIGTAQITIGATPLASIQSVTKTIYWTSPSLPSPYCFQTFYAFVPNVAGASIYSEQTPGAGIIGETITPAQIAAGAPDVNSNVTYPLPGTLAYPGNGNYYNLGGGFIGRPSYGGYAATPEAAQTEAAECVAEMGTVTFLAF